MNPENTRTRLILVDDHDIVRHGFAALIQDLGNYEIVGQYSNGQDLIDAYPWQPDPHLILLDMNMPKKNGRDVIEWAKDQGIATRFLMLTLNEDEAMIPELFRMGLRGYLQKNCTPESLSKAIESIREIGYYHNEFLTRSILQPERPGRAAVHVDVATEITERERTFLELVCDPEELTYDTIATKMYVGRRTLDHIRERLFEAYGIRSKTGLVLFAIKHGIVRV